MMAMPPHARRLAGALALVLSGCLPASAPLEAPRSEPAFRPEAFFAGHSHGDPTLKIRMRSTQRLKVESLGEEQANGTFRLHQTITYPDGHADERTWTWTPLGDGRYAATLTPDATGPVEAHVDGNTLTLRYPMGGGMRMDQTLRLHPDGQSADNVATVRWHGMAVARLTETIVRDDD